LSLSYPCWLEDLVKRTGNYTLYEAYEILNELLEERAYFLNELGWEEDTEKRFSKEELILYLLTNSNFYVFI